MQNQCHDNFSTVFRSYPDMLDFHAVQARNTQWVHTRIKDVQVESLDSKSPYIGDPTAFAGGVSLEAIADTAANLGLALRIDGQLYPVRMTAYKSLLDRAKIGGTALPKLNRGVLAQTLNACLGLFSSNALALVRDEKVAALHSGDSVDYSVLPIDELLSTLQSKLDARFPDNEFEGGYSDHAITSATWRFPAQREDILDSYITLLKAKGMDKLAGKLMPGIRFITSDTGVASAKVSAMIFGFPTPINIGGCIAVDHRHSTTVTDFATALDQLFAQFGDNLAKLEALLKIDLAYPVNAMTRVCKKLCMPKKEAIEAIAMFEMSYGNAPATAHDVFMAMQEIIFSLKANRTSESKIITLEENMARALSLNWHEYDLVKKVDY